MLVGRKRSSGSFGTDGRRKSGGSTNTTFRKMAPKMIRSASQPESCSNPPAKTNKLFHGGCKIIVRRAPVLNCLSIPAGLQKKFQRPMTKRRAYDRTAEVALKKSSLGNKRRMDGMAKLMARAGRGLAFKLPSKPSTNSGTDSCTDDSDDEKEKEDEKPFEPLRVWESPHQGGELKGLPPRMITEQQADECGVEEAVTVMKPAPAEAYHKQSVFVPPVLAKWLRPHQREGVVFMYECVMGLRSFNGNGCILADDMGLGKTLQSVALIYTMLKTGITANGAPTAKRVIVVCPCSLVKNWDNEFVKWLGPGVVKTLALAESDRKTVEKNLDIFVRTKMFNVLIVSYETIRTHIARLVKHKDCCDLLVCDEAHRLKNQDNQTSKALNSLPVKRRILLTGTPMQNNLEEFYAMVDFTNQGVLAPTGEEFRKRMLHPILRGREPDASDAQKRRMMQIQNDMSSIVNDFILRRINTLNAQHLPPKLVQVVCCNLTEIQQNMYQQIVEGRDMKHVLDGKQENCLGYIQMLMKLCNHPSLIVEEEMKPQKGRRAAAKSVKYSENEPAAQIAGAEGLSRFLPYAPRSGHNAPVFPEWSGKMFLLYRLMKEMRRPGNGNDKIVIVSNYTQTLDLIGRMCRENSWGCCRLDGSITMKKRQKMVEEFNDPSSSLVAFLLSSKAGGCGLNLIGGNRLVLFDPDWNPAVDAQAAARCWRDGQKKRCFTYRFLATGTVEEKIFQRQLAKQGLQQVVDDKEQVNALSTKDLRNLFKLRCGTPSDTHDKLRCERCKTIADNADLEASTVLPQKLEACRGLLDEMIAQTDANFFLKPLIAQEHGVPIEEYEKKVKQPMDLGTIRNKLNLPLDKTYESVSGFSKDVNRIFSNVMKVWMPGQDIADAARRLQAWWLDAWTNIVPVLMQMKADGSTSHEPEGLSDIALCSLVGNERGDNFQEQIGFPDEEDMRSWSHHHSADTADDPVLRAAMRGFDTVSFIFGLEVTWSLIQQRQQDEEEKQAMLELAEAQKCNPPDEGDDEGSSNGMATEGPKKNAGQGGTTDNLEEIHENGIPINDSDRDAGIETLGEGFVKDAVNDSSAERNDDDDGNASRTPEAPATGSPSEDNMHGLNDSDESDDSMDVTNMECSPNCLNTGDEVTDTSGQDLTTQHSETQVADDPDPLGVQTSGKHVESSELGMQSSEDTGHQSVKEPMDNILGSHSDDSNDDSDDEIESSDRLLKQWVCHACTFHNTASRKTCQMCRTKNSPPKKRRIINDEDDSD